MLSPEYMDNVTDHLIELYQNLEEAILEDIADRINRNGYLTATAERQAEILIENGYTTNEIETLLKPYLDDIDEEIQDIVDRSSIRHYEDEMKAYRFINKNIIDLEQNRRANNVINSAMDRLIKGNGNLTHTMGVVYNKQNFLLDEFYKQGLNDAVFKVASGAFSRGQVVRKLINDLSSSGIKIINYQDSGRNYTMESAAKMLVRTTLNQMTGDISLMNAEDMGQDLMELSAHAGARPSHAEWQGQIVSLSGDNDKYLTLDDVGYGDVTGFMGANCRHNWYPFFEGISERNWTKEKLDDIDPEPFEFEDKEYTYYEATQKQRQIERTIRKYKHRVMMYDKVGDKDNKLIAQVRLQRQRQLYKDFNKAGKLRPTSVNTNVYGYNKDRYNEEVKSRKFRDIYTEKRFMQSRLDYINPITNFKEFIPSKTIINHSKAIYKGDEIRVVNKLCEKYGGKPNEWSKMVGRVDSELYYFDVHWYEKNNIQYEMKFKHKSRRKK